MVAARDYFQSYPSPTPNTLHTTLEGDSHSESIASFRVGFSQGTLLPSPLWARCSRGTCSSACKETAQSGVIVESLPQRPVRQLCEVYHPSYIQRLEAEGYMPNPPPPWSSDWNSQNVLECLGGIYMLEVC